MLLAHAFFSQGGSDFTRLCIVPAEFGGHSIAVPIDHLPQTSAAVFHIGPREAVNVVVNIQERTKIIWPIPPALFFLTPDNPGRPGIKAVKVKITFKEPGDYDVFFTREISEIDRWSPWNPLTVR